MRTDRITSLVLLALAAAGCAADTGRYPSLAMRPFERGEAPAPAVVPPAPAPNRPVEPARLAQLRAAAGTSHAAFLAMEADASRLARAAAGQSVESASYAAALVALSELDTQRGKTAGSLAAIDALAAEAAATLAPDPPLNDAQTEIAALLAQEDAAIARLWTMLGT